MRINFLNILVISVISYFLITDILILIAKYEENTFENLIDRKVISDSLKWNVDKAKIVVINDVYGKKNLLIR